MKAGGGQRTADNGQQHKTAESRRETPEKRKERTYSGQSHCFWFCSVCFEVFQLLTAAGNHTRQTDKQTNTGQQQQAHQTVTAEIGSSSNQSADSCSSLSDQQTIQAAIFPSSNLSKQAITINPCSSLSEQQYI
jgi:hypothetical protein